MRDRETRKKSIKYTIINLYWSTMQLAQQQKKRESKREILNNDILIILYFDGFYGYLSYENCN